MDAQPVHVVGHTGEALVIERRQDVIEVTTHRSIADWPDDERAQRAWCLDRALGSKVLRVANDDDPTVEAERFRAYINNES